MSRDFELLQRIERSKLRPRATAEAPSKGLSPEIAEIAEPPTRTRPISARSLTDTLSPEIRNELVKAVQRVFLATMKAKAVMFTGMEAGHAAKWIAACSAEILADAQCGPVAIVDADLASPTLHELFGIPNKRGLTDALRKGAAAQEVAQRIGENLWVVTAGTAPSQEQITPSSFQNAVVELLDLCDFVLVAAPEPDQFAMLGAIGSAVQGAILVLDAERTRRVSAQRAKLAMQDANIQLLGSVLTNHHFRLPAFLEARL
jgi:protein-tyrosine kinase